MTVDQVLLKHPMFFLKSPNAVTGGAKSSELLCIWLEEPEQILQQSLNDQAVQAEDVLGCTLVGHPAAVPTPIHRGMAV